MSTWTWKATRRWPGAVWQVGDGRFASVSDCRPGTTVLLCPTLEEAEKAKADIDRRGCGGLCGRRHAIYVLGPPAHLSAPVEVAAGGAS